MKPLPENSNFKKARIVLELDMTLRSDNIDPTQWRWGKIIRQHLQIGESVTVLSIREEKEEENA